MNTKQRLAAMAITAGIAGVGALALMTPAVAQTIGHPMSWVVGGSGNGSGNGNGTANGNGTGNGSGHGMMNGRGSGQGMMSGQGGMGGMGGSNCTITAEKGTLTDAQKATLARLTQEEQLARDLYRSFADKYSNVVFQRIATAEEHHLTLMRTLLSRYDLTDPTKDQAAGKFTDAQMQATYDRLLAEGQASEKAALGVGKTIEQTDISDLKQALEGLTAPDVKQVYQNLVTASQHHLSAFGG